MLPQSFAINNVLWITKLRFLVYGRVIKSPPSFPLLPPDESDLFISPTLLSGVSASDSVMMEEVFGPLLPFVTVESMDQAIQFVRQR